MLRAILPFWPGFTRQLVLSSVLWQEKKQERVLLR